MGRQHDGDPRLSRLPREPIDRVTGPLARFLRIETAGGAVLLVCTATALALSNSSWAHGFFAFALIGFRGGGVGTGSRSKRGLVRGRERG